MSTVQAPALFTVAETAQALRLSRAAIYKRVAHGHLNPVRLGTGPRAPVRIPARELARYIAMREA